MVTGFEYAIYKSDKEERIAEAEEINKTSEEDVKVGR
jgi:hypothetical protein